MSKYIKNGWKLELETKPDFEEAMNRIYAWYEQEMVDRPPIRFYAHNANISLGDTSAKTWNSLEEYWMDAEYRVEEFINFVEKSRFLAETFPVFWPNLGPGVFASFYGCELKFEKTTSYTMSLIKDMDAPFDLKLDRENRYFKKIDELTNLALERCKGKFMVGYTDLHPGMDCVADWRDPQELCMDLIEYPERLKELLEFSSKGFQAVYDMYDERLKKHGQLSVTWMGIPSFGKMHIPSCDFSTMISPAHFEEFCLPVLQKEVKAMTHNVFHLDGKNCARHLDAILAIKEICAIQWVQGVGDDKPIMQWIPLIQKIQKAGKSVVVDLKHDELEAFMGAVNPKGIMLTIDAPQEARVDIVKAVEKWAV